MRSNGATVGAAATLWTLGGPGVLVALGLACWLSHAGRPFASDLATLLPTVTFAFAAAAGATLLAAAFALARLRGSTEARRETQGPLLWIAECVPTSVLAAAVALLVPSRGLPLCAAVLALAHAPPLYAILRGMNSRLSDEQRLAAFALGASRWDAWRVVVFPHGRREAAQALALLWNRCAAELAACLLLLPDESGEGNLLAVRALRELTQGHASSPALLLSLCLFVSLAGAGVRGVR